MKWKLDSNNKRIILNSDFQRDDVCGIEVKFELSESVLKDLPLPIWDELGEMRTSINDNTYECEYNGEFPNCILKTFERNIHLLSLRHDDYI